MDHVVDTDTDTDTDTGNLRRAAVFVVQTLAVAACYYGAGRLGLLRRLTVEETVFTPVWPPTGVALTCLLIIGLRAWPGIALGCLFVILHLTSGEMHPPMLANLTGNVAAPVCAYLLLRRVGFRTDLTRLRDGVTLVFLGALTAMLISSTTGVGIAVLTGDLGASSFWPVWVAWWVGDAMGVLIVTPLLLMAYRARGLPSLARWKEATALAVTACVVVPVATHDHVNMLFLTYPVLIWAALRFELPGSMLCVLLASVLATVAATDGAGPFAGLTHVEVMLKLQAFNGATALTALLLSAVITEQRNTRRSVERACEELAEVLEHLTAADRVYPPDRSSR
ncbi:MASE1 domain-containing protein [Streptomyces acidiscabies]|uniref:MASE1 domain-containing protein n=1 Tax=Streptomyces acidiscabies TaxID=42234 RepID=UPI0002880220|nr:MASE1 domain-containing protein [Streptomyces acidiscabies]MBZ3917580.1 MASE1 domain-containing protein [Streptomyces acidiscabies]MDX3790368.1 MASE1 domain-containing protein [Streptomyces acidiscabies]GAV39490.1 putative diguanylate cyclase [Streptomyces acidiscabies]